MSISCPTVRGGVFVPGLEAGQVYAYRVNGPMALETGHRFDSEKILLDPYGRSVAVPEQYQRSAATGPGDNRSPSVK
jgi:glycogen operon protein